MRSLAKLERLEAFLRALSLEREDVQVHYVTAQDDATSLLNAASGLQVLVARPEMRQSFGPAGEDRSTSLETAVFALEKSLGAGNTPELEREQFDRCEQLCDDILNKLFASVDGCSLGLAITNFDLRPELSLFGGWNGYSMSIAFS